MEDCRKEFNVILVENGITEYWASRRALSYDYTEEHVSILIPTENNGVLAKIDDLLNKDYDDRYAFVYSVDPKSEMFEAWIKMSRLEHRILYKENELYDILAKFSVTDFWVSPYFSLDMQDKDFKFLFPFKCEKLFEELRNWHTRTFGGSSGSLTLLSCRVYGKDYMSAFNDTDFYKIRVEFATKYNRFIKILKDYGITHYYSDTDVGERRPFGLIVIPSKNLEVRSKLDSLYFESYNCEEDESLVNFTEIVSDEYINNFSELTRYDVN